MKEQSRRCNVMCVFVCLYITMKALHSPSFFLFFSLFILLSRSPSLSPPVCLCPGLSVCVPVCLSVSRSVCLCPCLCVCPGLPPPGPGDQRVPPYRAGHHVGPLVRTGPGLLPEHRADQREDGGVLVPVGGRAEEGLPQQRNAFCSIPSRSK